MDGALIPRDRHAIAVPGELMIWLSPSFPVGAFAYSHGLELAVERGWLVGRDGLEAWLADLIAAGSLRTDLIILAATWRAARLNDIAAVETCNAVALALQPSAERYLETVAQGQAFRTAISAAWTTTARAPLWPQQSRDIAYPVAVATATAAGDIALESVLYGYGLAFVSNLTSAAIRLSVIGQTDGQRVIAALLPHVGDAARDAATTTFDDLGSAALRSDLASLAHETQYTRLFRS